MNGFGAQLKYWRKNNKLSQLELSLIANISSKHISFLETERANPSRSMIITLADALNIPLHHRNHLFSASGYLPTYSQMNLEQPEMHAVKNALTIMLNNHNPYPALVLDWDWNILMANNTQQKLSLLVAKQQPNFPQTNNLLELIFDPNAYRPFIKNWQQVALILLTRIKKEKMLHQDRRSSLLESIIKYPDLPKTQEGYLEEHNSQPMLQLTLAIGETELNLFSTIASFGTAIDITMQELMIEQYFPADDASKIFFEKTLAQC